MVLYASAPIEPIDVGAPASPGDALLRGKRGGAEHGGPEGRPPFDVVEVRGSGPVFWVPNDPAGTWDVAKLPITFVLGGPKSRDVGDEAASEIDVALRTWSRIACTGFRARFGGVAPSAVTADDGINVIVFHDDAWPSELVKGALAQTIVHVDPNGKIRDSDIHINGKDFRFSLDGAPGTQDLRSVLVHEIGHALGLGHSLDARATMHASGSGLRWRSLEKDDVDGVCALYPGLGATGCPAEACPSGFACVGGGCQRLGERSALCSPCVPGAGACEAAGDDARCVSIEAGRVCGRACSGYADCGSGFSCTPTTEAGDRQCIASDGCRSAASPCTTDAECKGFLCRSGACVGPLAEADAGAADAGSDAAAPVSIEPRGGCDCRSTNAEGGLHFLSPILLALVLGFARVRSRRA